MITLIEGPDCAGKTTLIKSHFSDHKYVHFGAFKTADDAYYAYAEFLTWAHIEKKIIVDRMLLSELVYGAILRSQYMKYKHINKLINRLLEHKTVIVICLPPLLTVMDEWQKRHAIEYVKDRGNMLEIYDRFMQFALSPAKYLPTVIYDWTDESVDIIAEIEQVRQDEYN